MCIRDSRYIEDTAALYVEQLNTDITKINYEIITLTNKKREINSVKGIRPCLLYTSRCV